MYISTASSGPSRSRSSVIVALLASCSGDGGPISRLASASLRRGGDIELGTHASGGPPDGVRTYFGTRGHRRRLEIARSIQSATLSYSWFRLMSCSSRFREMPLFVAESTSQTDGGETPLLRECEFPNCRAPSVMCSCFSNGRPDTRQDAQDVRRWTGLAYVVGITVTYPRLDRIVRAFAGAIRQRFRRLFSRRVDPLWSRESRGSVLPTWLTCVTTQENTPSVIKLCEYIVYSLIVLSSGEGGVTPIIK